MHIVTAQDTQYEEAKQILNTRIDSHPAAILYCEQASLQKNIAARYSIKLLL